MPVFRPFTGRFRSGARTRGTRPAREAAHEQPRRISDNIATTKATSVVAERFMKTTGRPMSATEIKLIQSASRSGERWYLSASPDGTSALTVYRVNNAGTPQAQILVSRFTFDAKGRPAERVNSTIDLASLNLREGTNSFEPNLQRAIQIKNGDIGRTQVVNNRIAQRVVNGNRNAAINPNRSAASSGAAAQPSRVRKGIDSAKRFARTKAGKRVMGSVAGLIGTGGLGTLAYFWLGNDEENPSYPEDEMIDGDSSFDWFNQSVVPARNRGGASNVLVSSSSEGVSVAELKKSIFERNVAELQQILDRVRVENRKADFDETVMMRFAALLCGVLFSMDQRTMTRDTLNYIYVLSSGMLQGLAPDTLYYNELAKTLSSRAQLAGRSEAVPINDLLAYSNALLNATDLI